MRKAGIILIALAVLSWICQFMGWTVPVLKLFSIAGMTAGHLLRALAVLTGVWLVFRRPPPPNPLSAKRWKRFRSIRRGYVSFILLCVLAVLGLMDTLLVGKRALCVRHGGTWHFPFLLEKPLSGKTFGLPYDSETNYRELQRRTTAGDNGDFVILPLVPYDAALDTQQQWQKIVRRGDGQFFDPASNRPFTGIISTFYKDNPELRCRDYRVRRGVLDGISSLYDTTGSLVETVEYREGVEKSRKTLVQTDVAALAAKESAEFRQLLFPPVAPAWDWDTRHFLGTDSGGADIAAQLFAGFQLQMIAALFYCVFVFGIGISLGCAMGYFGGKFDLAGQRFVEIWSSLPFIYVVIMVRSMVAPEIHILVAVLALFSWMELTYYMRGGTYAEKARDYVAAARLIGASTPRVIFRHIVPNVLSTLVTKLPFVVEALIFSLTALDFLGFGLPPGSPSWGAMLKDGTANMQAPWIISSAFSAIAVLLVLITFVGEAVREAFDPKKFTTYQ
jgi:microcin C transport system permease protein